MLYPLSYGRVERIVRRREGAGVRGAFED
jgi:hypothetical protein